VYYCVSRSRKSPLANQNVVFPITILYYANTIYYYYFLHHYHSSPHYEFVGGWTRTYSSAYSPSNAHDLLHVYTAMDPKSKLVSFNSTDSFGTRKETIVGKIWNSNLRLLLHLGQSGMDRSSGASDFEGHIAFAFGAGQYRNT